MTIFHIPSWYPSANEPFSGIFIKEFIECFSLQYPATTHIVSNQAENNYEVILSQKNILRSAGALAGYVSAKQKYGFETRNNISHYCTPKTLIYSPKLGFDLIRKYTDHHAVNLDKAIRKHGNISLIHAHVTYPAGIIADQLSKKFRVPFIITEHLGPFRPAGLDENEKVKQLVCKALDNANAVISVSNAHAKQVSVYTSTTVQVIPNLVNENFFQPSSLHTQKKEVKFLTVTGFYELSKGIPQLLSAIAEVTKTNSKLKFIIAGNDPQLPALRKTAKELNIESHVTLLGKQNRSEVKHLMQECDVFILPSQTESFGLVYAEAIACGKPVVATRCGGPEDIVNETNGLLIPVDDEKQLEESILFMAEKYPSYNPGLIRNGFLKRFSAPVVAEKYYQLYNSIIQDQK